MAITVNRKHNAHPVRIHLTREGKHHAALRCIKCDKHIQWLSRQDANELREIGVETWRPLTTHDDTEAWAVVS